MHTVLIAALLLLAPTERVERGNLVLDGIPEVPESFGERLAQYQNVRSASFADWLPDGREMLVATRFGETSQLHRVATPLGMRRQITFFDEPVGRAQVSPDPGVNGFPFGRDAGGSEFYQLFFYDLATAESRMLTDGTSRNGAALWACDGRRFAYYTTRRNGRDHDVHVLDLASGTSRAVLEGEGAWYPVDWSPDDTRLLVVRYVSANEAHPWVLDVESGELTELRPREVPVAYGDLAFDAAGTGVWLTSDEGGEFLELRHLDLATGELEALTSDVPWDVEDLALSRDRTRLAFAVNEEGYGRVRWMDAATRAVHRLEGLPTGVVGGIDFSPEGTRLALTMNTPSAPGDVYVADLASGAVTRWTESEIGGLDPAGFVEPELVRFPSFDGRSIPAFYYAPAGEGPFPVVIDIHGGPEGQERPTFNPTIQYLARELGVAVLAPNVRGSAGYGKSWLQLDNGFQREDTVKDIGALLDWIETHEELDADRVAVMGGSYGGYMVLAALVHYDARLRAAIDVVGITNFVTFLENTQDYRRDLRRVEYGDERDPKIREFLERISPTTNAERITKPLFIAQGANDPRVPASESEQMVDVIRKNGGEVWYLLAKDEGHGFRKKTNRDAFSSASMLFLERHLAPGSPE